MIARVRFLKVHPRAVFLQRGADAVPFAAGIAGLLFPAAADRMRRQRRQRRNRLVLHSGHQHGDGGADGDRDGEQHRHEALNMENGAEKLGARHDRHIRPAVVFRLYGDDRMTRVGDDAAVNAGRKLIKETKVAFVDRLPLEIARQNVAVVVKNQGQPLVIPQNRIDQPGDGGFFDEIHDRAVRVRAPRRNRNEVGQHRMFGIFAVDLVGRVDRRLLDMVQIAVDRFFFPIFVPEQVGEDVKAVHAGGGVNFVVLMKIQENFVDDRTGGFILIQRPDGLAAVVRVVYPIGRQPVVVRNAGGDIVELFHAPVDHFFRLGQLVEVGTFDLGAKIFHRALVNDHGHEDERNEEYEQIGPEIFPE